MRRSNWMLSTEPNDGYQTVYTVADFGKIGRARRDDYESTHIETVIRVVPTDQYRNPIRIIARVQSLLMPLV